MTSLSELITEASEIVESKFNMGLEKSKLSGYNQSDWIKFCLNNGFDSKSDGLYVPSCYRAYVNIESDTVASNVYHELFGHGLFCENSLLGKRFVEELEKGKDAEDLLHETVSIQKQHYGLATPNLANYEGFALWLEDLICRESGQEQIWKIKEEKLPLEYMVLHDKFLEAEENLTTFGFLAQLGFPKFYTGQEVCGYLRKLYGSEYDSILYVVLYGSRKPYSDIDLLVVADNEIKDFFNGWVDIYNVSKERFKKLTGMLDISVTDPLFTGNLIYGDQASFEMIKKEIISMPINEDAIQHNYRMSEEQKRLSGLFSDGCREYNNSLGYAKSFQMAAQMLERGDKILTKRGLEERFGNSR